ncbi:selenoprotein M-like [Spea bombifrons]|uniref:selenoprotein M-like n=1 Tax=Spea bombifrons TaxID=233779 RepID=UPI00234A4BD1|nr:selenoprotein M-like [Spea bombifrons]
MAQGVVICVLALCLSVSATNNGTEIVETEDTEIARGTVIAPSVVGCYIKSMPELYHFMMNIWALYHNLEYDSRDDKEPQIIFYNYKNEVLKVVKIKDKTSDEISAILNEAGFYRKSQKGEEVPKEFQHFPLKTPRDEL